MKNSYIHLGMRSSYQPTNCEAIQSVVVGCLDQNMRALSRAATLEYNTPMSTKDLTTTHCKGCTSSFSQAFF